MNSETSQPVLRLDLWQWWVVIRECSKHVTRGGDQCHRMLDRSILASTMNKTVGQFYFMLSFLNCCRCASHYACLACSRFANLALQSSYNLASMCARNSRSVGRLFGCWQVKALQATQDSRAWSSTMLIGSQYMAVVPLSLRQSSKFESAPYPGRICGCLVYLRIRDVRIATRFAKNLHRRRLRRYRTGSVFWMYSHQTGSERRESFVQLPAEARGFTPRVS